MQRIASSHAHVNTHQETFPGSHPPPKQDFTFDTVARVVRALSKGARVVYCAMQCLADGRTGELRIGPRWLKGKHIDREAQMCERTRQPYVRELIHEGLVTVERTVVRRTIGGRLRAVSGPLHYTVHKRPILEIPGEPLAWKRPISSKTPTILQNGKSCRQQELPPQIFPETPCKAVPSTAVFDCVEAESGNEVEVEVASKFENCVGGPPLPLSSSSSKHHETKPEKPIDDDEQTSGGPHHSSNLNPEEKPTPTQTSTSFPAPPTATPEGKPTATPTAKQPQEKPFLEERPKQNQSAALRAWMRATIAARQSSQIEKPAAHRWVAETRFLADLEREVETFLFSKAEDSLRAHFSSSNAPVPHRVTIAELEAEAAKHELPVKPGDEVFLRALRFAQGVLGLVDTNPAQPEPPKPVVTHPPRSKSSALIAKEAELKKAYAELQYFEKKFENDKGGDWYKSMRRRLKRSISRLQKQANQIVGSEAEEEPEPEPPKPSTGASGRSVEVGQGGPQ